MPTSCSLSFITSSYSKIVGVPEFNAGRVGSETPEQQTEIQYMEPTWWTFQSLFQEKQKFLEEGLTKLLRAHLPQHCSSVFIGRGTCLDKSTSRDKFNFKEKYCCLVEEIPKPLGTKGGTVQRETKWGRVLTRASQPWEHLGTGLLFNIATIFGVWILQRKWEMCEKVKCGTFQLQLLNCKNMWHFWQVLFFFVISEEKLYFAIAPHSEGRSIQKYYQLNVLEVEV